MPGHIEKSDLRVVKTTKTLNAAMFSLLEQNSFKKITVRDICDEAQISRATFYARFADKYDFLRSWLVNLMPEGLDGNSSCDQNRKIHNDSICRNKSVIKNLLIDTDCETLGILAEFMLGYFKLDDKYDINRMDTEHVVLSNFFAGGMIFYILWHVKHSFPSEISPMNIYLYELIKKFREWELDAL